MKELLRRRQTRFWLGLLVVLPAVLSAAAFPHTSTSTGRSHTGNFSGRLFRCFSDQRTSLFSASLGDPSDPNNNRNTDTKSVGTFSATEKNGYQFGDITRGVLGRLQSSVNSLTGKEKYEFGDLSKWLDQSAKKRVQQFTQRPNYRFGDITKELIRRLKDGDYNSEDLWLFVRIALLISRKLVPPVAAALPVRVLMELVEVSMAQSVSEDLTAMLTGEVNQRMKQFITGDKNYQLGDITKKILTGNKPLDVTEISKEVAGKFTGQDVSTLGDISKRMWKKYRDKQQERQMDETSELQSKSSEELSTNVSGFALLETMDATELNRFEEWDRKYLASHNKGNILEGLPSHDDFQLWDERLIEANKNGQGSKSG